MLIKDVINETSAGAVASVVMPIGKMIKRPNPSVFSKSKVKKKKKKKQSESV